MSFFYDLNKRLANLGQQQKQISESVEKAAAKKSPVQKTLEQALRTDLKSLMEGQTQKDFDKLYAKAMSTPEGRKKVAAAEKSKDPHSVNKAVGFKESMSEDGTGGQSQSNTLEAKADYSAKKAAAGKDIGKPGKNFAKIAKKSGGGEKGQKIAGAVLAKLRAAKESVEEASMEMEGNAFSGAVAKAKADGIQKGEKVKVGGKTYPVKEQGAGGIHGRMPDPMTQKDQQKKMNPPRSLEEKDESEEDIMDYLNRKLAPHDKQQQAKEDACAVPYNKGSGRPDAHNGMEFEDEDKDDDGVGIGGLAAAGGLGYAAGSGMLDGVGSTLAGLFAEDESVEESVSRKHFQQVADLLKNIPDEAKRKEMALHHASIFAKQNPRFDIRRFGQAAGVDLEECALWEELKGGQVKLDKNHNGSLDANDFAMLRGDNQETDEGWDDAMAAGKAAANQRPAFSRHDVKDTGYSKVYTRKPETFDEPGDEVSADAPKRGRGRPASNKTAEKRVTKGAWKHKADEGVVGATLGGIAGAAVGGPVGAVRGAMAGNTIGNAIGGSDTEVDEEKQEAGKRKFFDKLAPAAKKVAKVVSKVTGGKKEVDEESTEKKDSKAEKAGKKVAKDIEHDEGNKSKSDNKAEKAGKKVTKDIEYDDKKDKEEKVDETTTSGSVATASTSSKGAGQVGKGIYDSWNRQFEKLLAESVNVSQEATKMEDGNEEESITINVTGDDVARFKEVLASMGLGQQGGQDAMAEPAHDDSCHTCGGTPCQCDELGDGLPGELEISDEGWKGAAAGGLAGAALGGGALGTIAGGIAGDAIGDMMDSDEEVQEADAPVSQNSPDYPTNQEYDDDALQYAGGLNKPKQTGQSTVPVLASQKERQVAESTESVDSFLNLYKAFAKTK